MAGEVIRPQDLPNERTSPVASEFMVVDNGVTVAKSKIVDVVKAGRPAASQAEAEAGTDPNKAMTPLTTKQAIEAQGDVRFASAVQGAKADTAVQPGGLATVAVTGAYADLAGKPTLGTAAATDASSYATAVQGGKADTAIQSVVAGANTTVDNTDPRNPVVSSTGEVADGDKGDISVVSSGSAWKLNRRFGTVAALLADTALSYTSGAGKVAVSSGDIVEAQGFRYAVVASGAADVWLIASAGGVKLSSLEPAPLPEAFGAAGSGAADDTASLNKWAAYHAAKGLKALFLRGGAIYLTDGLVVPAGTALYGARATIKRRTNTTAPVVEVGANGTVRDLIVDGSLSALGESGSSLRTIGIGLNDYSTAENCESFNNRCHGIGNMAVSIQLEYQGCKVLRCYVHDNGSNFDPAGTGQADGIAFVNVHHGVVRDCRSERAARSAFTATTYDVATADTKPALSVGCLFDNLVVGSGHGYLDSEINMEKVTAPSILNCRNPLAAGITFRGSIRAKIAHVEATIIAGTEADYASISDFDINHATKSHERLSVTGLSPVIRDGRIKCGAVTAGNCVNVLPSNQKGAVFNVSVDTAQHAFRLDVDNYAGLVSVSLTGSHLFDGPSSGTITLPLTAAASKNAGRRVCYLDAIPTTGTWAVGDQVWRRFRTASQPIGWICGTAGAAGTFVLSPYPNFA